MVKLGLWPCCSCLGPLHHSLFSSGRALRCGKWQWEPAGHLCDPVSAPTHPGLWLGPLARSRVAPVCASLQLGAPHRGARAAARVRRGRWSVKNCAFIFIQCSQGIGCVTQKNNLIINPCLHSKFRLGVPALQSLLAAALFWGGLDRQGLVVHLAPVGSVVPAHILGNGHNSGKLLCSALDCVICIFNNLLGVAPCKFSTTGVCAVTAVQLQNWVRKCTNLSCNGCHCKERDSRIGLGF